MALEIVILAAGLGTRMKSSKPKALHSLAGKPVLSHLLDTAKVLGAEKVHVVIGKGADQVKETFRDEPVNWVLQSQQLGTGHALKQALPDCDHANRLLILLGDAPLVTQSTLLQLLALDCDLGILSVILDDPFGYGRIIRSGSDQVKAIIEEKDASDKEKQIGEINTGVMVADVGSLNGWIDGLDLNNAQGELLLTDIVTIAAEFGGGKSAGVKTHITSDPGEVMGVNDMQQLAALEREFQMRTAADLMKQGVRLADPSRFDLRGEIEVGLDVEIDVNCIFEGQVTLGDGVKVGPNCVIRDCDIGAGTQIKATSVLEEAVVGANCIVGPFARLRPGTRLEEEVSIGNFVEVKKSTIGKGTKASHLSYLGDATIGSGVNIGAGTITCNYDGENKNETLIGDGVFVGSNSALVAPITISENVYVAAGSTITKNVKAGSLTIARGRQRDIENWNHNKK